MTDTNAQRRSIDVGRHDSTPLVSVVMAVTRPQPVFFTEAVESVLGQSLPSFELVIVEKPSPVPVEPLLQRYADSRIRHLLAPPDCTLVAQRNLALEAAGSDYVAVLDADDVCEPNRLEVQYKRLRDDPQIAVLGSQIRIIDERGAVMGQRRYPCDSDAVARALPRFNPIAQPSVMFRRSVILSAGSYRYSRFPATEDYELWSRLATGGAALANHPEPLVRYRIHAGSLKSHHVHGILRGTLEIKKSYWKDRMDLQARARFWAEHALLIVPPSCILALFRRCVLRRRAEVACPR